MSQPNNLDAQVSTNGVGAVVVTFNSAEDLEPCLSSLKRAGVEHVVVIDNASSPAQRERTAAICGTFDFVAFEQLHTNLGFGAGVNFGVSRLRSFLKPNGFVWIVNPDTEVQPDCVQGLLRAVNESGLDIVSAVVTTTSPDGKRVIWYRGGDLDSTAVRTVHRELGQEARPASDDQECSFITGAAMFMKLTTWDFVGGFSEDFFLYWEDADLSARASKLGLKTGLAGSSFVWHSVGGSGDRTGKSPAYYYYMQRNRIIFSKNAGIYRRLFSLAGMMETLRLTARPLKQSVNPFGKFVSGLRGMAAGHTMHVNQSNDGTSSVSTDRAKPVFISWTRENGRSKDLAEALGADLHGIYPSGNLLVRYFKSSIHTYRLLRKLSPQASSFIMLPPMPLAIVAKIARGRHASKNIFDLHTGFFHDPKWRWLSGVSLRAMRGSTAIVTNENLVRICAKAGVESITLHDVLKPAASNGKRVGAGVVCPVSYSNDEPIDAILKAAGELPDTKWILTGRAPASVVEKAPANIEFTGFVSDDEYDRLISEAGVVLALTNRKDTMQRAGYEAILRGVPVVTSDFDVLRDFFEDSAVYVAAGESDLASQVAAALDSRDALAERGRGVLNRRIQEQTDALEKIRELVSH